MRRHISAVLFAVAIAVAIAAAGARLAAHHTISTVYDVTRHATLTGVIAEVDWKQPHVIIHLDVKSDGSSPVSAGRWDVETQGPDVLKRSRSITQDFFKPGDTLTATVCVAKDGGQRGWLKSIATPAGERDLSAGGC